MELVISDWNRGVARRFDAAAGQYDRCSNPYTTRRRAETLASFVRGRWIELGGGTGAVSAAVADRSRGIHSDIAPAMCRAAVQRLHRPSLCFDAQTIPLKCESVDAAVSAEMIYYLENPDRFLGEAFRVLKPGGRLILSTTNPAVAFLDRARAFLRRLGFRQMFFDDGAPEFPPVAELTRSIESAGFQLTTTRRIVVLPFASMHFLNRLLERTLLNRIALFIVLVAQKKS